MRIVTVGKQFTFHAAHQLPHHNGLCKNEHGHTYKLEVTVTGKVNDAHGGSDEGMVIDFADVKAAYQKHIEPHVEHQNLNMTLFEKIPGTLIEDPLAGTLPCALTTCENIARWIHTVLSDVLLDPSAAGEQFVRVTLWETPTSFARVPADRNGVDHQ